MRKFENFIATKVPLEGSNLIEASAGTGKTYSIAILVLRLILEKKLPVKEILMVTFTKAAVAELEERIRLFIRQAYKASMREPVADPTITQLVINQIELEGQEAVQGLLKDAVLFLDETSVLTIHSFCQQTLNEFAFETRQLFGAELVQDTNSVLDEAVNKFWRRNITSFPVELLSLLIESGLSRSSVREVVKDHLGGKRYLVYQESEVYGFCDDDHSAALSALGEFRAQTEKLEGELYQYITNNCDRIKEISTGNRYAKKARLHELVDNPQKFIDAVKEKRSSNYIIELYADIVERCEECEESLNAQKELLLKIVRKVNCYAIKEITVEIDAQKRINNHLFFDDLIGNLHQAILRQEGTGLVECLQRKYKAVFIDEFQDTDKLQYEIFQRAFGQNTILFYIGDPKQSIYAWRKADLFTYFKAKDSVNRRYSMNNNFRSSEAFIKAMNLFFMPHDGFDTFYFGDSDQSIDYTLVDSPASNTKGDLHKGSEADIPITITSLPNKGTIEDAVAAQVLELLTNPEYSILKQGHQLKIRPTDIGILVRTKEEGRGVNAKLAKLGIPAVTISDDKVLKSEDAKNLLYVLEAMLDISRPSISKALLTPFTGYDDISVASLNSDDAVSLFRKYRNSWEKEGIYKTLKDFIADFRVEDALLRHNTEYGERVITNLYQLIELLHKAQTHKRYSPPELVSWFKRGIEGMETDGDEYQQRIENDEDAVKIVTIHSSKGLEYKIVLAPFLDLQISDKGNCSYRDPDCNEYVSAERSLLTEAQIEEHNRQLEQENRRLIYVAITRGVYKCYIYRNTHFANKSSLLPFYHACASLNSPLIELKGSYSQTEGLTYRVFQETELELKRNPVNFSLLEKNWSRMSYSRIRSEHHGVLKTRSNRYGDQYDHFVFSQLAKGANTGNMLHYIFENVHFSDTSRWAGVIDRALLSFAPHQRESQAEMLMSLLEHVFNADLSIGDNAFTLSDVVPDLCIHEFEFDFPVLPFRVAKLEDLSDERIEIAVRDIQELEGIMNGKIDLFFEHDGKYYVLDWKSNFLGDALSDYSPDNLDAAMNDNNYHLQYLIYTLATKKYLESRVAGFDYERDFGGVIYLFIRGVREGSTNGIYTSKPPIEKIEALESILSGGQLKRYRSLESER